jgi:hypothetical protein
MTITAIPPSRSRTTVIAAHALQVPVVREPPPRLVAIRDTPTW